MICKVSGEHYAVRSMVHISNISTLKFVQQQKDIYFTKVDS
jgi:hypothetical protein